MNVRFQSLFRLGIGLNFPLSLIYVSVIYVATVAVILWAGLAIYLAVTGGFSFANILPWAVSHRACGCSFSRRRSFPQWITASACGEVHDTMVAVVLGSVAVDLVGTTVPQAQCSLCS
jgi:hypothetical protein